MDPPLITLAPENVRSKESQADKLRVPEFISKNEEYTAYHVFR
jgi:hypothetical protein